MRDQLKHLSNPQIRCNCWRQKNEGLNSKQKKKQTRNNREEMGHRQKQGL